MALSEVSGYHRALQDALFNEDPDLWHRDEVQRQVQDARNFLERLRQSPPEERVAYSFWESRVRLLETLIKSVQDKPTEIQRTVYLRNNCAITRT